ncbi:MAG: hypothetical protein JNG84_02535 [Archangium sp.]|nr:hypothetical protein [Archangium sp.]
MEPINQRREAVQRAYAVFRAYRRTLSPTTSYWTMDDPEIRAIQRRVNDTALTSLDPETLRNVVWNATGDERSLKHFLPRVLDCIDSGTLSIGDLTVRLEPVAIRDWPEQEARVLRDFLVAGPLPPDGEALLLACETRLSTSR